MFELDTASSIIALSKFLSVWEVYETVYPKEAGVTVIVGVVNLEV